MAAPDRLALAPFPLERGACPKTDSLLATAMTGAKKLAKRLEGRSAYFLERRTLAATATG